VSPRCRKCVPVPEEVREAADLLGSRWTLTIVYAAHSGATRFNELKAAVGPIPPRTLVARLGELEAAGIVERVVVDARPPQVEYRLTAEGHRLEALLAALTAFAAR
jgi:DNA-binding HxlR family transcriptional regulator